ncbi:MAG: hypothetical protein ABIO65_09945 [Nitrospiria bacterium]
MSRTRPDLENKLAKKWLSSNAIREGLLTSLILTLRDGGAPGDVDTWVDRAAQEAFKRHQADEEYAPPETLRVVLAEIEQALGVPQLAAELLARHRATCEELLAKADRQSGYR